MKAYSGKEERTSLIAFYVWGVYYIYTRPDLLLHFVSEGFVGPRFYQSSLLKTFPDAELGKSK